MENYLVVIILAILALAIIAFSIFIYLVGKKIEKLEDKTIALFKKRTNLIPSLFEVTEAYLEKHSQIFEDIIYLKKLENSNLNYTIKNILEIEAKIHHEIEFIFKVASKNPKILKNGKFLYIRDLLEERSEKIGTYMDLYSIMLKKYNKLITIKNLTIIGLIIPLQKKTEI